MNYRNFLITLVSLCTVVVVAVFLVRGRGTGDSSPYGDLVEMRKLPYDGLRLRGEEIVKGREEFEQAMDLYERDDLRGAADLIRKAVKLQPDSCDWWLYLGVCYHLLHETKDAIAALERANELADDVAKPNTRWYLAHARLAAGQRDAAEELLDKLIKEGGPRSADARDLLIKLRKVAPASAEGKPWISYPGGGERFISGQSVPLEWYFDSPTAATRYRIMLSFDGGVTYPNQLALGVESSLSQWTWQTSGLQGNRMCVRIDAVSPDTTILGVGSEEFSVSVAPWLMVNLVQPRNLLRAGLEYELEWKVVGVHAFDYRIIAEQINSEGEYEYVQTLVYSLDTAEPRVLWKNRLGAGDNYRFKLHAEFTDTVITASSAKGFSVAPGVYLYAAAGNDSEESYAGRTHKAGDAIRLNWELEGEQPRGYTVELCDTLGKPVRVLARDIKSDRTSYEWNNRDATGTYLVRVLAHYPEGDLVKYFSSPVVIAESEEPSVLRNVNAAIVEAIELGQNYPNPFNGSTVIRFELPQAVHARLSVYNALGQEVRTLIDQPLPSGPHMTTFDAQGLASGTYIYRLDAAGKSVQKKMVLTR